MEPYIGQIMMFAGNYAPENWAICNGALLSISSYEALFSLIGTTYGGDGRSTFGIPDLRGRLPVGQGQGTALSNRILGNMGGEEGVTLTNSTMPVHNHNLGASTVQASTNSPNQTILASVPANHVAYFDAPNPPPTGVTLTPTPMGAKALSFSGSNQPHDNRMPTTAINYIIALLGIYPPQP